MTPLRPFWGLRPLVPGSVCGTCNHGHERILMDFKEWLAWCEAEGTDPEVMTFEHWIDEMRTLAEVHDDDD